jgi:hypothetical protein
MKFLAAASFFTLVTGVIGVSQVNSATQALGVPGNDLTLGSIPAISLEYGKPVDILPLPGGSGISAQAFCGADGGALLLMNIDDNVQDTKGHPLGHSSLVYVKANGEFNSIPSESVPGYTSVFSPEQFLLSGGNIYVLTSGLRNNTGTKDDKPKRENIVLVFDGSGALRSTIPIDPAIDPTSFGVFGSGDLLILSEDPLNQRMQLSTIDSSGRIHELRLSADDFTRHKGPSATGSEGAVTFSPVALIAMTEIVPYGANLLLVPLASSNLPVLEIDESRVVRSVVPHLPKGAVVTDLVPSSGRTWQIRLGLLNTSTYRRLDTNGQANGASYLSSKTILEVNPSDGEIIRQIDLGVPGVHPVCERDGVYTLLTSRHQDKMLQLVTASPR